MKTILIVVDGLSDRPTPQLNKKTPLQVAKKPMIDSLAKSGICGLMHTIDIGVVPGTDSAHLAIFGYDPTVYYPGRGIFEAVGCGLKITSDDIAFRCNLASVDENLNLLNRRAKDLNNESVIEDLINSVHLLDNVDFTFKITKEHRGVLLIRKKDLGHNVSGNDPHKVNALILPFCEKDSHSKRTSEILTDFTQKVYQVLKNHAFNQERISKSKFPINYLLVRGGGKIPNYQTFSEKYGISAASVVESNMIRGLCTLLGFKIYRAKGATGGIDSNLISKIESAKEALKTHDFVFIHMKGCDDAAHNKDAAQKVKYIEKVDLAVKSLLLTYDLNQNYLIITSDHSTPVDVGDHSSDPTPIVIAGPRLRVDSVDRFDEFSCADGGLLHIKGAHIMPIILDLMGKSHKFGA